MSKNNHHLGSFLLGAAIGGASAAVTALLLAPKSGEELRRDINTKSKELGSQAHDYANVAMEKGSALYNSAVDKTKDIRVNLKDSLKESSRRSDEAQEDVDDAYAKTEDEPETDTVEEDISVEAEVGDPENDGEQSETDSTEN